LLILYGCGDFITDYEGIAGYETFRSDLAVMYLPELATASGALVGMRMIPLQMRRPWIDSGSRCGGSTSRCGSAAGSCVETTNVANRPMSPIDL